MLFPDISCDASESMKRWVQEGICELLDVDHVFIVTIHRITKKCYLSASLHTKEEDNYIIYTVDELLRKNKELFLAGEILRNYCYNGYYFHMTSNKEAKNFIAFVLICKMGHPFQDKDLRWLDLYCSMSNRRTLVINENIQEKKFLKSIFYDSNQAIVAITRIGNILRFNPAAERLFNIEEGETFRFEDPAQQRRLELAVNETIQNNKRVSIDRVVHYALEGEEHILDISVLPLQNSKGKISGAVIVATDTTEIRFLSTEVEQLRQYGLLGELATGLAHDIKNPLMSIRGSAKLLSKVDGGVSELQEDLVSIIVHEAEKIDEVINQMMAYGDITHNLTPCFVNINNLLIKCARIIERQKFSKNIDVSLKLDENLPLLWASELHLQQVFLNLLLNSLQAISEKGNIVIKTGVEDSGHSIRVMISDDGTGFPLELKEKIFQPYFTTKHNGSGMGLFIVKRTLSKYNADISIESDVGLGTNCIVRFQVGHGGNYGAQGLNCR